MSRLVIVDIDSNGRDPVHYSYPRGLVEDFLRFVTRPNRFVIEADAGELIFNKVVMLRRKLINARETVKAPNGAWQLEKALHDHEAETEEFAGMSAEDLMALSDRVTARLELVTSPVWVDPGEPAKSPADELLEAAKA